MRTRLVALLSVLLLAPLPGQVAAASQREVTDPAAQAARERAEAALDRAAALFAERSPAAARRQLARGGRDATLVLNQLQLARGDLSAADRARAEAILARPSDADYRVPEAPPYCGDTICIHYVTSTADAPPLTDGDGDAVPDLVEQALVGAESVHDAYVAAGYRRPDPDGALGGGSDLVDIYLADLGADGLYGYCTTDQPEKHDHTWNYWAYCAIDDDFDAAQFPTHTPLENQQVTLAHEYFHAVQFAYDASEDPWFLEATATWAEDELHDDVDDNRQYLRHGQLGAPHLPLDMWQDGSLAHYGNWVFFRYLTERWPEATGGMPTIVRELLEDVSGRAGDPDRWSTDAVRRALARRGTSFPAVYGQFADANRRPGTSYDEGAGYPVARPARTWTLGRARRSTGPVVTRLAHLSNITGRFVPRSGTSRRLRIDVDMPGRATAPVARVAVHRSSGEVGSSPIRLDRSGRGTAVVPFRSRSVEYVELVLVNASLRTDCWSATSGPSYACLGTPKDDGARTEFSARLLRR